MELKVGMYIRGNYCQYRGKIGKIIKNYQNDLEIAYRDRIIKTAVGNFIDDNWDINGKQYKASYNIIDLIEVGDYVNGYKVIDKLTNWKIIVDYLRLDTKDGNYYNKYFFEQDIKSIVTKEQFESISYKVDWEKL